MQIAFDPDRLREARNAKDWSQSDLANALGMGESNVRRWEAGRNCPRADHLALIAYVTDRAMESFFSYNGLEAAA